MGYPYDDGLPGVVSPFGEVELPLDSFNEDMGELLPPSVDLSVPNVNPSGLPSAEDFDPEGEHVPGLLAQQQALIASGGSMDSFIDLEDERQARIAEERALDAEERALAEGPADWTRAQESSDRFDNLAAGGATFEGAPDAVSGTFGINPDAISGAGSFQQDMGPIDPYADPEFGGPAPGLGDAGLLEAPMARSAALYETQEGDQLLPFPGKPEVAVGDLSDSELELQTFEAGQKKQTEGRRLFAEGTKRNKERREANLKTREDNAKKAIDKYERIGRDAKKLGERGVDAERWWSSRSEGKKLGLFLSSIVDGQLGLISGKGGNDTWDQINKAIDRDIRAQEFNINSGFKSLTKQEGLVGKIYAATGDMYEAQETAREAALLGLSAEISVKLAAMDPEGSQARALETKKREIEAGVLANQHKRAQRIRTEEIEDTELEIKVNEANWAAKDKESIIAKRAEDIRLLKRKGRGTGGGSRKVKKPSEATMLSAFKNGIGWDPVKGWYHLDGAKQGDPRAEAELKKWQAEARLADLEAHAGPDGNPLAIGSPLTGKALEQADGSVFMVADPQLRKELSAMYTAGMNIRRIADLAKALRKKKGGSTSLVGSADFQELTMLAANLDFETYKAFGLGAPSAGDQKMAADAKGGKDITSYVYNASHGWGMYADSLEKKVNAHFRTQGGYTGKDIRMPRKKLPSEEVETSKEVMDTVAAGPRPDIAAMDPGDPERKASVQAARRKMLQMVGKAKDPYSMSRMAKEISKSGWTEREAIDIASPLIKPVAKRDAKRLAAKHKGEIAAMSPEELKTSALPWLVELRELESLANDATQHPSFRAKGYRYLLDKEY